MKFYLFVDYTGVNDDTTGLKDYFNFDNFAAHSLNPVFVDEFDNMGSPDLKKAWDMFPGRGGATFNQKVYAMIETLSADVWDWTTIEVHNPDQCNLKSFALERLDFQRDKLDHKPIDSIYLRDNVAIIDIEYARAFTESGQFLLQEYELTEVYILSLNFKETKDGKNLRQCEFRGFAKII